jgi:hypothetical protein
MRERERERERKSEEAVVESSVLLIPGYIFLLSPLVRVPRMLLSSVPTHPQRGDMPAGVAELGSTPTHVRLHIPHTLEFTSDEVIGCSKAIDLFRNLQAPAPHFCHNEMCIPPKL